MRSDNTGKKVQESEKLYFMLFDYSMDGIILTDPRDGGKILSANPAACRMLGWTEEELIGKKINVIFDIEDLQLSSLLDERSQSRSARAQSTCRRRDGTTFSGEVSTALTTDSNGEPREVTIIRDITGYKKTEKDLQEAYNKIRKQSEELQLSNEKLQVQYEELQITNRELSESRARLQVIVANSPDTIFEQDRDLRYVWIYNPAPPLSVPDVIGKTDADLLPPDQAQQLELIKRRVLDTGKREQALLQLSPGGEPRWFEAIYEPRYDAAGQITGVLSYTHDVTGRKLAEEELQKSRSTLQAILDTASAGIIVAQADGRILFANADTRQILGGSVTGDAHGPMGSYKVTMPDGSPVPAGQLPLSLALKGQTVTDTELLITRDDGTQVVILASATPLQKNHDKSLGAIAVFQDITERKRLEEQIHQRAEELETIMEVAPVGIWVSRDPQGHNVTGNKMANELYEAEAGENVSANYTNVRRFFSKGSELTANELPMQQASLKDLDVLNMELDILLPSGKHRTMLGSASPLHDFKEHVRGSVGTFVDITERKQAETQLKETLDNLDNLVKERTVELEKAYNLLKESEKNLSEAQEMAHLGHWNRNFGTNKLHWSDELYRIFGLKPQEFEMTYDTFLSFVHPDDREYVDNSVKGAFNGKPFNIDYRIVLANGEERAVHSQGEVVFDENNNPVRMRGTAHDITERKKAEQKIQSLANIVESSDDSILTESFDGIITGWNKGAERVYGYSAGEILGKNVSILEPAALIGETKRLTESVKQGERVQQYETLRLGKDGRIINISTTFSPVFDIHKKLTDISIICRDITQRKEAEETLAKIEEARIKEIHHRIKNNLQVISSLLDLQAETFSYLDFCSISEVTEAFKDSRSRIASMALIHEELYQGKGTDNLDFAAYIRTLTQELFSSYSLRNENISLRLDLMQAFLGMDIAIPLGIIINELVSNSLKHAFPDGKNWEISITLQKTADFNVNKAGFEVLADCEQEKDFQYILTVADNGKGVPQKIEFESSDSLGFQLVNILVEQIDGCIEFERNQGTKFTIWFNNVET